MPFYINGTAINGQWTIAAILLGTPVFHRPKHTDHVDDTVDVTLFTGGLKKPAQLQVAKGFLNVKEGHWQLSLKKYK